MLTLAVIVVVSGALIAGAVWGVYGSLPEDVEGFIVALAGGALLVSATIELIQPSIEAVSVWAAMGAVLVGAVAFSVLDYAVKEHWGSGSGGGLLAAITLDGVPENLALGVALIGAGPRQVVWGTRELVERGGLADPPCEFSASLGGWYPNTLFWRLLG